MSSKEQFKSVLERIRSSGKIPVDALKNLTEQERETVYGLYNEGIVNEALKFLEDLDADQAWKILREKVNTSKKPIVPLWKSVAKYAAIFIGLLAIVYFYRISETTNPKAQISEEAIKLKIGEDAIKVIREGESQQLVSASGKVIGEQKGNKISHDSDAEIDELVYNELEIPYGKIFDVQLSYGTLVHLNSGTKMRYPVKFLKGQKREVFIDGEAYFKVTKDKAHPFIVHADAVAVEVLGTEFNISSYKEDQEIKTVLVEGSVNLSNSVDPKGNVMLKPGQRAAWSKTVHNTAIEEVDVDMYTGWIKGELVFRNIAFKDMAKKLERRYNVRIQNSNPFLKDKKLNARFNVDVESLEDVLNSINEIQAFEYKKIGREVTIY